LDEVEYKYQAICGFQVHISDLLTTIRTIIQNIDINVYLYRYTYSNKIC
jgi:hypothetical protein